MFLKSLTLRGFKTFADSTEIELGSAARITAIVGPNGCGKSNLMDAARWVIGEDNPRHLRVAALSDIIFAGTDRRKPLSLAEVSLLFDNSSGRLPVPFTEVSIKRRTFREGESEFFINKNLCRLKDIKDLLLDTGLGEGSYSIITQGQVDAILSSKDEERRAVFEEAAGINKYKVRKLSAEKKLIAAEQNILRINDLKVEVGEHLISLEEQARRAKEYLDLQSRVKEMEIGLIKKLLENLSGKKAKLEEELSSARKLSEEKAAREKKDEEELFALREELRRIEITIEEEDARIDGEKDRLRDVELDRRFIEGEIAREEELLRGIEKKRSELERQASAPAGSAVHSVYLSELIRQIAGDCRRLFDLLSGISGFLGEDGGFRAVGSKEFESSQKLQLDLLEEERGRIEFGLQAHHNELSGLASSSPEAVSSLLEKRERLRSGREKLRGKIDAIEEKLRTGGRAEREAGGSASGIEIALAKLEGEMIGLSEKLSGEYNLTLPEIETFTFVITNVSQTRAEVDKGKQQLRALEPVNLLAIEEFEKTRERLTFIDAQLLDLSTARENLSRLITELDARAEENFLNTMQQLSVVFSETFSKLFSGGEARISLSKGKPALEADIEISVRPSGRRWLPLSLLSGGERALCAIAILFSLLKIRPSPFCFLDEVDAALDEANLGRFTEMLKDFSSVSQIVIITHNKRTMSAADNIYGITMEEPGVSRVISMKLTEAAVA